MKVEVAWQTTIQAQEDLKNCVFDVAYRPDGQQVLVAVGSHVLVYRAEDGHLEQSLDGHEGYVYTVNYARDGKRFASGGKDKTVIIWNSAGAGILKYNHNDPIQCLAFSPVTHQLASATATDFGLWSPEHKAVQKYQVSAKVLCMSWTSDGQYLALGHINGHVSVRTKRGQEHVRITRSEPIWCLSWSPHQRGLVDVLAVGCWDQTLSFYQLSGAQDGPDMPLGYDPCSLCFYGGGEYLLIGGSNRKVCVYAKNGVLLKTISKHDDWVWVVRAHPKAQLLCVGTNDGSLSSFETVFATVHGLYQDRYASRYTITEVIIQHLLTEQVVRIQTWDCVKKIAIYRCRLAIQLPNCVLVYETLNDDPYDMRYHLRTKIAGKMECNLLVVTSRHIILCLEERLQLFNYQGVKEREWKLGAPVRYIRVVGGPSGREGLLTGLKNGHVLKIFIDNPFPVSLVSHVAPIRCLDLSSSRQRLAVVDEASRVFVYDLKSKEIVFEAEDATSVAWNNDMEDMLCYSGHGHLCIKTGDFPIHRQNLQGFVVGFKGSKIFCLHYLMMRTVDVPQGALMHRYLTINDFERAYTVACLGVTDTDWRQLAMRSLEGLSFAIARKAFVRLRDVRFIELLESIETAQQTPGQDRRVFLADIMAFQGLHADAAELYKQTNNHAKAIEMYLDLCEWDNAKGVVDAAAAQGGDEINHAGLLKRQAQWLLENGEMKAGAEMLWAAGQWSDTIEVLAKVGWWDLLIERVREHDGAHTESLHQAAALFRGAGQHSYAAETYRKLNHVKPLIELYVELEEWDKACVLVKEHPARACDLYLPYAEWLSSHDRYDEAQAALRMAGRVAEASRMLEQLARCSLLEYRFADAGYYFWLLAQAELSKLSTCHKGILRDDHDYSCHVGVGDDGTQFDNALATSQDTRGDVGKRSKIDDGGSGDNQGSYEGPRSDASPDTSGDTCKDTGQAIPHAHVHDDDQRSGDDRSPEANEQRDAQGGEGTARESGERDESDDARRRHRRKSSEGQGDEVRDVSEFERIVAEFERKKTMSEVCVAYNVVHQHMEDAVSCVAADKLFQAAQFLLNVLKEDETPPMGVSRVHCLFTLARQVEKLGFRASSLALYRVLQTKRVPDAWRPQIELACLTLANAKDADPSIAVCYRCSAPAHIGPNQADVCSVCAHRFIRSCFTFQILPLVTIELEADISDDEALLLIQHDPRDLDSNVSAFEEEGAMASANDGTVSVDGRDALQTKADRACLRTLVPEQVFILKWSGLPNTYVRSVVPGESVVLCEHCNHFFLEEDWEFLYLQHGHCAFCRT